MIVEREKEKEKENDIMITYCQIVVGGIANV